MEPSTFQTVEGGLLSCDNLIFCGQIKNIFVTCIVCSYALKQSPV
jgi:hypothetical protein